MALVLAVVAHFVAGALLLVGLRRRPVAAALVGLVVLAATACVAVVQGVGVDEPMTAVVEWLPMLGFDFSFALDGFAVVMVLLVSVLGFGVLAYSIGYFEHDATFAHMSNRHLDTRCRGIHHEMRGETAIGHPLVHRPQEIRATGFSGSGHERRFTSNEPR